MKKVFSFAIAATCIFVEKSGAWTDAYNNYYVAAIGVHTGVSSASVEGPGYVFLNPAISGCDLFYVNIQTNAGRMMYSDLLQAYSTGGKISRVGYIKNGTACDLTLIEMRR